MKGTLFILTASVLFLSACSESTPSNNASKELPLECNEVIEKQVQLFKVQNRSEAEIESARKSFESEFSKLDPAQAAEMCRKQLNPAAAS